MNSNKCNNCCQPFAMTGTKAAHNDQEVAEVSHNGDKVKDDTAGSSQLQTKAIFQAPFDGDATALYSSFGAGNWSEFVEKWCEDEV